MFLDGIDFIAFFICGGWRRSVTPLQLGPIEWGVCFLVYLVVQKLWDVGPLGTFRLGYRAPLLQWSRRMGELPTQRLNINTY